MLESNFEPAGRRARSGRRGQLMPWSPTRRFPGLQERNVARRRRGAVVFGACLALGMVALLLGTIKAQGPEALPLDLSTSDKTVNSAMVSPGSTVQYRVTIRATGQNEASVAMTDTLPAGVTYVPNSVQVIAGGGLFGATGNTITWTGGVNVGAPVIVAFDAHITDTLSPGTMVTNTAVIRSGTQTVQPEAAFQVISGTVIYLPTVYRNLPYLNASATRPNASNQWTVFWTTPDAGFVTEYELQESRDMAFGTVLNTYATSSLSQAISQVPSFRNFYYYRVRAITPFGTGPWSNVITVQGVFRDDFNDPASSWAMRRQDTDSVANAVFYTGGFLNLEMNSSWDYLLAAPMTPAPSLPYRIETRVRLDGVDNLHAYGIVFGGDWNGQTCPDGSYSSCFTHYYRLLVIWSGANSSLRMQLKRIDFHDAGDNTGRGVDLISFRDVSGANAPSETWQNWAVEVDGNGAIRVYLNGNLVGSVMDATYINHLYFGAFAATDEYNGLDAQFDWYLVTPR